jgi:ketopantoate reductase
LIARGETLEALKNRGLKFYLKGERSTAAALPVHAIGSLAEIALPDVIVITVKSYDLDTISHDLRAQLGDHEPIVVALQNGVENQQVLPKYFARVGLRRRLLQRLAGCSWRNGARTSGICHSGYACK